MMVQTFESSRLILVIFLTVKYLYIVFFFFIHHSPFFYSSALPADTPLTDLGALASYDLGKLPDAKKTGEEIIRIIQQELLLQFGSKETAVVPEEHAQRLLVGVSSFNI